MAMKPLPDTVKSLFCASSHINSYKRAIEELVYNALDAQATSIAIRLDFPENTIQVIDNGCGVTKTDMKHIGKRYMTSKTVDLSSLKSVPNCYGFRGQSLATLIEVSRVVKITSRVDGTPETLVKTFSKGKEKSITTTATRPSKGTTVEIQDFLYNLTIQKNAVSPLIELQDTKHFLQHLSLVHNNVSISLRDNSNNNIVFQIHKCRDIYQTFSTLFTIEKAQIQELQVQKKLYNVTAYIGKQLRDSTEYHWVYLNRRFIPSSKLQNILNSNIAKLLGLRNQARKKVKVGNGFLNDEKGLFKTNIPFYFIFITCPYSDYDINVSSKTLELEFKNWDNITKFLEKLVKFYGGDVSLKEGDKMPNTKEVPDIASDTRDEVKKIMEKILASNSRKLGVSQMQNGIKGKLVKRKKNKVKDISLSKVLPPNDARAKKIDAPRPVTPPFPMVVEESDQYNVYIEEARNADMATDGKLTPKAKVTTKLVQKVTKHRKIQSNDPENKIMTKKANKIVQSNEKQKQNEIKAPNRKKLNILVKTFQEKPSLVKQRCKLLASKVEKLRQMKNIHNRKITYNKSSQYSNIQTKNQNITVKKRVGEIIIHESIPLRPIFNPRKQHGNVWNYVKDKQFKSSYDLLQTILKSQQTVASQYEIEQKNEGISTASANYENNHQPNYDNNGFEHHKMADPTRNKDSAIPSLNLTLGEPKLTYESHAYYRKHRVENTTSESYEYQRQRPENRRFITRQSKDNFVVPNINFGHRMKFKPYKRSYANYFRKLTMLRNLHNYREHSYTIEFSQTNQTNTVFLENSQGMPFDNSNAPDNVVNENMYTINREDEHMNAMTNLLLNGTYTIDTMAVEPQDIEERSMDSLVPRHYEERYYDVNAIEDSPLISHRSVNTIEDTLVKSHGTYCIDNARKLDKQTSPLNEFNTQMTLPEEKGAVPDLNVIFVSKCHEHAKCKTASAEEEDLDPLNICETILNSHELPEGGLNYTMNQKEIARDENRNHTFDDSMLSIPSVAMATNNAVEETSHHFKTENDQRRANPLVNNSSPILPSMGIPKPTTNGGDFQKFRKDGQVFHLDKDTGMTFRNSSTQKGGRFEFSVRNRPRYIPKGMSPIFENCNTKNACNYELDEDYFGTSMYDDFAKAVDANAEMFEANVESMNNLATKEINRVNDRLKKENASLCFQGELLREAKVLCQVDNKFIAAKVHGTSAQTDNNMREYLVLFDQHAVHERIRLETNLSEYLTNNQWKSVALDDVTIRLKPDEILYLHNYKEKFLQLGLQWTIEGKDEVSVTAIPEAIIGKNARQVEIIMKAVKSLILEEIEAIKFQKGCVSLYPKSIMDLVFSEACRYAIKFGDRLAHNDCVGLLRDLSECKTPFQCAHGRPVMAVLMEIKPTFNAYKINMAKLDKYRKILANT